MIKLIYNEFVKIFKKKTIYISLAILLLVTGVMVYAYSSTSYVSSYYHDDLYYQKQFIDSAYSTEESKKTEAYVNDYTNYLVLEGQSEYEYNSWEYKLYVENAYTYIYDINYAEFIYEDDALLEEAKKSYDEFLASINSGDYISYLQDDLENLNIELDYLLDNNYKLDSIEVIVKKLEIEMTNLRIDENIPNDYSFMSLAIDSKTYHTEELMRVEESLKTVKSVEEKNMLEAQREYSMLSLEQANYTLEHGIEAEKYQSTRNLFTDTVDNSDHLLILGVILMASAFIMSNEFSKGTIKSLLIRPYSRLQIITAKYLTSVIVLLSGIIVIYLVTLVMGMIFIDVESLSVPIFIYNPTLDVISTPSIFEYTIMVFGALLPKYLLTLTFGFCIGVLFNSGAISIILTALGFIGSTLFNAVATGFNIEIMNIFPTLHWNFTSYLFGGNGGYFDNTLGGSIVVCFLYYVAMILITWYMFKKRNIKNI